MTVGARPQRLPLIELWPGRRQALAVKIGDLTIGAGAPIAVQSMTTTRTADAAATARQVIELARAGCDLVRVTVPSGPDAAALPEIRSILKRERVQVPLVADIHFTPKLALEVCEHVEKVRINPGNFADKKQVGGGDYDEARWQQDVERMERLFAPVVERARDLGVALRIGTNHGSLSDRIVHRFGDSPEGMVESALEFIRICEAHRHRDLVISMKASNTQVMVAAYRLLADRLDAENRSYPLHLGVTEAGGGDEGRMKSSVGIATLLAEGLGDTVRVSLTEDPCHEVPAARELVEQFAVPLRPKSHAGPDLIELRSRQDATRRRTQSMAIGSIRYGDEEPPRVELAIAADQPLDLGPLLAARPAVELIDLYCSRAESLDAALDRLAAIPAERIARGLTFPRDAWRRLVPQDLAIARGAADRLGFVVEPEEDEIAAATSLAGTVPVVLWLSCSGTLDRASAERIERFAAAVAGRRPLLQVGLVPSPHDSLQRFDSVSAIRLLAAALDRAGAAIPLLIWEQQFEGEDPRLGVAGRAGALLIDGLGDALRLEVKDDPRRELRLVHGVLQAARRRLEQAEYIACPSCGRTLFDLETTTHRIRERTAHLKLKIAVMGCVVNGPGEMADADFGFVGWGEGKVALFVGKKLVERDIPYGAAPDRLIELIKEHGRWEEPSPMVPSGQ